MTSASGEFPPRPDKDEQSEDSPTSERRTSRRQASQANLWSEDGTHVLPVAPGTNPPPFDEHPAADPDEVWASPDRRAVRPADAEAVTVDPAVGPLPEPAYDAGDDDEGVLYDDPPALPSSVRVRHVAWELVQTLLLAALIFLMVRGVAQNFRVEGPSMEPGLHNGQYLLVNKAVYFKLDLEKLSKYLPFIDGGDSPTRFLFHGPQRGDVIVFRYPRDPSRDFIKRIIGLPGDTVSISDGVVTVNGSALEEQYINTGSNSDMEDTVVPEGSYFVMGDNRPNSSDSRTWGFVPEENIIGKAMFSYWPLSEFGGVGNTSIDLGFVKIPVPSF
jgi:signal peptidase I